MFTLNKKVAILLSLLFTYTLISQNTYNKRIHYGVNDNASQHVLLYNDTFYLPTWVGVQNQLEPSPFKASLLKVDLNGNPIQPQTFYQSTDSTSITAFSSLYKSSSNKFYSAATISHWNKNDVLSGLVIFDKNGDTLKIKTYSDTTYWNGIVWVMKKTNEPNRLLLFGLSDSLCSSGHNGYCRIIARTIDTLGNLIGTKYFLSTGTYKELQNVDTTSDKGYVISGFEALTNSTGLNYVLKLDSNLNQVWDKTYFSCNSIPNSIYTLKGGGYVQSYASMDSVFQSFAYFSRLALQKIDKNGNTLWNKEYGHLERNVALTNVKELPNGDLIACGALDITINTTNNLKQLYGVLLKTDSMGNEKWMQIYKGVNLNDNVGQSYLYDIVAMPDGGFTSVGWVGTTDTSAQLTWILRVDSNGCLTPGCTPMSTGIKQVESSNEHLTAYPNPFNEELTVSVTLPENTVDAKLQLIEPATGRILMEKTFTDKQQAVVFDTKELSSGLYLIGIKSANTKAQFIKVTTFK